MPSGFEVRFLDLSSLHLPSYIEPLVSFLSVLQSRGCLGLVV